jgi:DNA-directed RNA polymerase subunit RPC12/RpoP
MTSLLGKEKHVYRCPKCLKELDDAWVLKYESEEYTKFLYLCSNCGYIFKIKNDDENFGFFEHFPVSKLPKIYEDC